MMRGHIRLRGKGVCTALAISNTITNLSGTLAPTARHRSRATHSSTRITPPRRAMKPVSSLLVHANWAKPKAPSPPAGGATTHHPAMRLRRRYAEFLRRAAALPSLPLVSSLHAALLRRGVPALLAASLIQGYYAYGDLASARALFDETPPTLSSRTALAGVLSAHGWCAEALAMLAVPEVEADDRAVTVLLAARARVGMVAEGRRVFARVTRLALQHYTCMVEMLGRAGEVEEAERLVVRMEARPDRVVFTVLLTACRVHGRVDVAERVACLMRRYGIA